MTIQLPLLVLGISILLLAGMAFRYFFSASRSGAVRREELKSKHLSHQPWDSADGRANR